MIPIEKWCSKRPSFSHLIMFRCVAQEHILDYCRKKLDAKSHACIMMGYSKELKSYQLFDLVKHQIIIKHNVIFEENTFGLVFLTSSSGQSYGDPFGIVKDTRSNVPFMSVLINSLDYIMKLTGGPNTPTETITSPNLSSEGNGTSLTLFFTSVGCQDD